MNQLEKALFELRIEIARNPTATSEAELDAALTEAVEESDASVQATAEFFNLNMDAIGERAGKMQFDGGASRVTANRLALTEELQRTIPRMSGTMCRWFAQNMATVAAHAREHGMSRDELAEELRAYFRQNPAARTDDMGAIHDQAV